MRRVHQGGKLLFFLFILFLLVGCSYNAAAYSAHQGVEWIAPSSRRNIPKRKGEFVAATEDLLRTIESYIPSVNKGLKPVETMKIFPLTPQNF